MCGIAGIIGPPGASVSEAGLRRMTRRLTRRGPDEEGYHEAPGVGLGHRRLSILDLTGGRQPLSALGVHAVVNGEIYNFRDLRRQLQAEGCIFRTGSDSEVVAHGYRIWGEALPAKLEGMYALAAWSQTDQTLLLARDRLGQKPLYYALRDGWLVFASEVKALVAAPGPEEWTWELDRQALAAYLCFECLPESSCIFSGVQKVRPGEQLTFLRNENRIAWKRYWTPRFGSAPEASSLQSISWSELTDRLGAEVLAATERRLMSDVPIGVLLSGGVDSSVVAAAMARLQPPQAVQTFSIGFEDPTFDESSHALAVAQHLGTRHRSQRLAPREMVDILPEVADYMDEPLGDASIFPTYLLSRFVRQHVKVALGGDGGDELFLGYPTFVAERVAGGVPTVVGPWLGWGLSKAARLLPVRRGYFSLDFKVKRFARGLGYAPAERHARWLSSFSPEEAAQVLVGAPSVSTLRALDVLGQVAIGDGRDVFDELSAQYLALYLASDVLLKVDRASMAHGLEVRAPLLDRQVVELACAMPSRFKLDGRVTKAILKRLARRWLPSEVVDRPKQGFGVPIADWLRGPLRELAHELLAPARLARQGLFEPSAVQALWSAHQAGTADHRKPLWTLIAFQLWFDRYGTPSAPMRAAA